VNSRRWRRIRSRLAGEQTLQVETFDPFEFEFPSGEIVEGTELTATTAPHAYTDSLRI